MTVRQDFLLRFGLVVVLGWSAGGVAGLAAAPPPDGRAEGVETEAATGIEVQTRGPLHEGFAELVTYDPAPGPMVSQRPPRPINEVPPGMKPRGRRVMWLPGYWGWEDEREDFVWVSGVWRVPPPGSRWVPGYWAKARGQERGYQRTSGFWSASTAAELEYLPPPPQSVEAGPSSPPPSADHFWVPGNWTRQRGEYAWRAGYWSRAKRGWTWAPARYASTPSGSVFVPGHWDYPLRERGVPFAPVYFDQRLSARSSFSFTPNIALNAALLTSSLFARPSHQHYYFGDYYDDRYAEEGYRPWYAYHESGEGYDPIYSYDRWYYGRSDPDWLDRMRDEYRYRFEHEDARPPRTFADLEASAGATGSADVGPLALELAQLASSPDLPLRLVRVNQDVRLRTAQLAKQLTLFAGQRLKLETGALGLVNPSQRPRPLTLRLPRLSGLDGPGGVGEVLPRLPGVNQRPGSVLPDDIVPPVLPEDEEDSLLPELPIP